MPVPAPPDAATWSVKTSTIPDSQENDAVSVTLEVQGSGYTAPITWALVSVTPAITGAAVAEGTGETGTFTATPTADGDYTVRVRATDALGVQRFKNLSWTVEPEVVTGGYLNVWPETFGLAPGVGQKVHIDTTVDRIRNPAVGGTSKVTCVRMPSDLNILSPTGGAPAIPSDAIQKWDASDDKNLNYLLMGGYVDKTRAWVIPIGNGSGVAGQSKVTLGSAGQLSASIPATGGGNWTGLSIHGGGIPELNPPVEIASRSGADIFLSRNGAAYTLPAGTSFTNQPLRVGGTNSSDDAKMPIDDFEAYGQYYHDLVLYMEGRGYNVIGVMVGNEVQHNMGALPYADPVRYFKAVCHACAGAKKAKASVITSTGGWGGRGPLGTNGNHYRGDDWYTWDQGPTNRHGLLKQADYLNSYWLGVRTDYGVGGRTRGDWPSQAVGAHLYRDGGGLPDTGLAPGDPDRVLTSPLTPGTRPSSYECVPYISNAFWAQGQIPIMFWPDEQGPHWSPQAVTGRGMPSDRRVASATESFNLTRDMLKVLWGLAKYPSNGTPDQVFDRFPSFTLAPGAPGAPTAAQRKDMARKLFLPPIFFSLKSPTGGIPWDTLYLGLWTGAGTPGTQKWQPGAHHDAMAALVEAGTW